MAVTDTAASYPAYLARLEARVPQLATSSYAEQRAWIERDNFVWSMPYHHSMAPLGYEVLNVDRGIDSLQRAWLQEAGLSSSGRSNDEIVLEQACRFKPDVLMYEASTPVLLKLLLDGVSSIRLVIGWAGSKLSLGMAWRMMDVLLTCAPESIGKLADLGLRSRHVNHSFNPALIERTAPSPRQVQVSFVGSIVRRNEFHLVRERLLLRLADVIPLEIYSPSFEVKARDYVKMAAAGAAHVGIAALRSTGTLGLVRGSNLVKTAERIASPLRLPVNPRLTRHVRPGVYGLDYYQLLRDSGISVNIHADTSPEYASNIRLFEATGMGSCLLTDWKSNIAELFDPDTEIVVFRSEDEAVEKARWLLEHPRQRADIAAAGARRTLRDHTSATRAAEIDQIIREELRRKDPAR